MTILIVTFEDNDHVNEVVQHLDTTPAMVNVAWFPATMALTAAVSADNRALSFTTPDGQFIDMEKVGSIWYRRLRAMTVHEDLTDETSRLFAWSEANEALLGTWYAMHAFWMNSPLADEAAQRKVHQLRLANDLGLAIPDTVITNDPDEARGFIDKCGPGNVIRKAFRNISEAPRETALVTHEDVPLLDSVRYAPVIFQEFVPAAADLRVTVVDGEMFPAAVYSDDDHRVDYRRGLGSAEVRACSLPDDVSEPLRAMMKQMDLAYGAVDFRLTPDGEYVFLEVNPAGEFLFISRRTDLPIPQAIAAALSRHDRHG